MQFNLRYRSCGMFRRDPFPDACLRWELMEQHSTHRCREGFNRPDYWLQHA